MSVDSLIFWLFVAAWAVVLALILFVQVPRIIGEARRAVGRVLRLVDESPVPLQIAKAEADLGRMSAAMARIPALQARARAAISVIRDTPRIPPAVSSIVARLRDEVAAFRSAR